MTTAITTTNGQPQETPFLTESDKAHIRRSIARDANDTEFEYFVKVASLRRLNPLLNQIALIIRNSDNPNKRSAVIQTTIHGLRLIADRTKRYCPGRAATYTYDKNGNVESATAYVMKYHAGSKTWHEVSDTAFFREYKGTGPLWSSMPHVMLAKCAEALALRRAFPEDLSGLYTDDEMGQADVPAVNAATGEVIDVRPVIQKPAPPATHQEYTRLFSKLIDLGVTPEKDGKALPPSLPPGVPEGRVQAAVDYLRALVVQAEDMSQPAEAAA